MSRKGQEEIVGFVVVMVLVAIVFVVILSISLRQTTGERESVTLEQFLGSVMEYTSTCVLQTERVPLGRLFEECRKQTTCDGGKSACSTLKESVPELVKAGLAIGEGKPYTGYMFSANYLETATKQEIAVFRDSDGTCKTYKEESASDITPTPSGVITVSIKVC